jgi:hypothetical protein
MLISKPMSAGDVVSIKILNGDELIARLESDDKDSITISRPLALTMGTGGLGMIPWVFLGNSEKITLQRSHIFFVVPSKKDAADQYVEGTTGIALVK